MSTSHQIKILLILFLLAPAALHAEDAPKKQPRLEDMSAAELKEALKKSHAEIESRLGSSGNTENNQETGNTTHSKPTLTSMSEKRAYESSAQSQINALDLKIQSLEDVGDRNWGYAQRDAYKVRDIQAKAREELFKIKSDNTDGWKSNKQTLDSLLRSASNY